jgi:hypothetical protein
MAALPPPLDEIEEERLVYELERRLSLRAQEKCDYCERVWGTKPCCKFPSRHMPPRKVRMKA